MDLFGWPPSPISSLRKRSQIFWLECPFWSHVSISSLFSLFHGEFSWSTCDHLNKFVKRALKSLENKEQQYLRSIYIRDFFNIFRQSAISTTNYIQSFSRHLLKENGQKTVVNLYSKVIRLSWDYSINFSQRNFNIGRTVSWIESLVRLCLHNVFNISFSFAKAFRNILCFKFILQMFLEIIYLLNVRIFFYFYLW